VSYRAPPSADAAHPGGPEKALLFHKRDLNMEQVLEFTTNHPLLVGGFIAVLLMLIWTELRRRTQGYLELPPAQAVPWINDGDAVIVDISPVADFNRGHIVNARNYQPSRLAKPDAELLKLKDKKLLVVCRNGNTAIPAAANLRKMGAEQVAILKGGMTAWRNDQFPVTTK
jgi:rhodanese-related sulfurtransferase